MKKKTLIRILTTVLSYTVQDENGILKVSTRYGVMYLRSFWWLPRWYLRLNFRLYNEDVFNGSWKEVWTKLEEVALKEHSIEDSS